MDEFEDAFRTGLRRINDLDSPVPSLDAESLTAAPVPARGRWRRTWLTAAVFVVVAGVAIGSWIVSRSPYRAVPAGPPATETTPTPTVAPNVPATRTWTKIAAGPLSPRWEASGVWVDGRFLVVGGHDDFMCPPNADCILPELLTDGARYDPATDTWTTIAPMPWPVIVQSTASVGTSAYFSGWRPGNSEQGWLVRYDTTTDQWSTHALPGPAGQLIAAGDRVLVIANTNGANMGHDLVFDSVTGTFTPLPDDPIGGHSRGAVWLGDRLLLAAISGTGGRVEGAPVARLAELDGTLTTWRDLGPTEVIGWNPVFARDRVVWPGVGSADGGENRNWGRSYPYGRILDPSTGAWTNLPTLGDQGGLPLTSPHGGLNGSIYPLVVAGHVSVNGHLLDPVTLEWTTVPHLPGGERPGAAFFDSPDAILTWGGGDYGSPTADGYLLRVAPS
ncbi:MAG: hypothetical protein QM708_02215 [Propioniciclava sp.]|uniref:Kelch repeat-containing protein n=1 Tax=Propioniciclava sp. TaxID=2038686 RepID=UPI0039E6C75B